MNGDAISSRRSTAEGERSDDRELLRSYAEERSEAAFTALVRRHLNLVYFAALRQVGGDAHTAEEVTQTVFTDLARKAASLCHRPVLASWLHTSTHFAAAKARRTAWRRNKYEQEAQTMPDFFHDAAATAEWERLRPTIDIVIQELNETDREAVLQRFFEGRSFAEIGAVLNLSEDAARMRVDRALGKLHILLARRGITSTAAALGTVLAGQAVAAAPAGLAASIAGTALSEAVDAGASAGVLAFMSSTKITLTLAVAAAVAIGVALFQSSRVATTAAELTTARGERSELAARLAAVQTSVTRAEQEFQARTVALEQQRSAASRSADPAAAASEQALQAKALRTFLDSDPQLQELHRNFLRVWRLGQWAPYFQQLRLTPAEIEQTLAELQWRQDQDMHISNPAPAPGWPEALARNARFADSLKYPDARDFVDQIVREGAKAGVMFTREKADQLFRTFVELQPVSPGQRDPYRVAMRTYDNWQTLRLKLDWDRVIAQAGGYLDSAQLNTLHVQAALARRNKLDIWYQ